MDPMKLKRKVNTIKDLKDLISHLKDSDEIFFDLGTKATGVQTLTLDIQNIEYVNNPSIPMENYCVITFKTDHTDIIESNHNKQQTLQQIKSIIKNK